MESRMTNQLSGGQQQRVALARALVLEPRRAAVRRAAEQSWTPSLARDHADGDPQDPAEGGDHGDLRHARPVRGDEHFGQDHYHEQGEGGADRHAAGDLLSS